MKIRFQVIEVNERKESPGQGPVRVRRTTLVPIDIQGSRTVSGQLEIIEQEPAAKALEIDAMTEVDIVPVRAEDERRKPPKPKTTGRRKR